MRGVKNYCQAPGPCSGDGQGLNLVLTCQSLLKTGPGLNTIIKKPTTYPHPNAPHTLTISTETFISAITTYNIESVSKKFGMDSPLENCF